MREILVFGAFFRQKWVIFDEFWCFGVFLVISDVFWVIFCDFGAFLLFLCRKMGSSDKFLSESGSRSAF